MNYFEVYKTIWNFHKKYGEVKNTEAYWDEVIEESKSIHKQYNKSKFVKDLLVAVVNELERKGKQNKTRE